MIQLKNIHKAADRIFCDAFVEDCKTPVSLELDPEKEEFREVCLTVTSGARHISDRQNGSCSP